MGRKKSKGKKKRSSKKDHRREDEGASDNGCSDPEQAQSLPPSKKDNPPINVDNSDSEPEVSFKFASIVDPVYVAYLQDKRDNDKEGTHGVCMDRSHEMQLVDSLNFLRLIPPRPIKKPGKEVEDVEEIARMKAREMVVMERVRQAREITDTTAIAEQAIRIKDILSPLLPDLPTINLELQDLPGMREESPKKKPRKTLSGAKNAGTKNLAKFRETAANLVISRGMGGKIKEFEVASAVDQAINFAVTVGRKHEQSKSSAKKPNPPLFHSNSPTGAPSQQSRNNETYFRSELAASAGTGSDVKLDGGRKNFKVNSNENSLRKMRRNRNTPSTAVENYGSGQPIKTELGRTVDGFRNLNRSEYSAQDQLQENNNLVSNPSSTPRRDLSVRKKSKKAPK